MIAVSRKVQVVRSITTSAFGCAARAAATSPEVARSCSPPSTTIGPAGVCTVRIWGGAAISHDTPAHGRLARSAIGWAGGWLPLRRQPQRRPRRPARSRTSMEHGPRINRHPDGGPRHPGRRPARTRFAGATVAALPIRALSPQARGSAGAHCRNGQLTTEITPNRVSTASRRFRRFSRASLVRYRCRNAPTARVSWAALRPSRDTERARGGMDSAPASAHSRPMGSAGKLPGTYGQTTGFTWVYASELLDWL